MLPFAFSDILRCSGFASFILYSSFYFCYMLLPSAHLSIFLFSLFLLLLIELNFFNVSLNPFTIFLLSLFPSLSLSLIVFKENLLHLQESEVHVKHNLMKEFYTVRTSEIVTEGHIQGCIDIRLLKLVFK